MTENIDTLVDLKMIDQATDKLKKQLDSLKTSWVAKYPLLLELHMWWYERKFLRAIKKALNNGLKHS